MSEVQEENKALVRRFLEAQDKGDLDAVKEMMAPPLRRPQRPPRAGAEPRGLHKGSHRGSSRLLQLPLYHRGPSGRSR